MAATLDIPRNTARAEDTVVKLQRGAMIPGAREPRVRMKPVEPPAAATPGQAPDPGDRARLIYELEGGGAPRERSAGRLERARRQATSIDAPET
jgi:hypothetical protein